MRWVSAGEQKAAKDARISGELEVEREIGIGAVWVLQYQQLNFLHCIHLKLSQQINTK
jgi:hypothetical protein